MLFLEKILGTTSEKAVKALGSSVVKVAGYERDVEKLSAEEIIQKTTSFKVRLTKGETLDDIMPEAFALVREVAKRTLGERHYDVQIIGGIVLHHGNIAEMRTGEGKTLVATLPAYLNALTGEGVHIVTVNDYLARRDAVWMGQIYASLGLSVGVINHESSFLYDAEHLSKEEDEVDDAQRDTIGSFRVVHEFLKPCTRSEAYNADITFGTNNEFGFDYLRDHLAYDKGTLVQRGHAYAIVDEIDSILIDEARTPLIISGQAAESEDLYRTFARIASQMKKDEDYTVDEKSKSIAMIDAGITKAEKALKIDNLYTEKGIKYVHHLETAVRAKALFEKDKEYVVKDNAIIIVDEFTGRLQPGRRWSEGLHQAIEAKENVHIERESRTLASVTFQNYFRLYGKLSGMTGTAMTSSEEFFKVYGLEVIAIPTHRDIKRIDRNDLIFQSEIGKWKALTTRVKELNQRGQPVLIGTASIDRNEILSEYFKREGIPHEVLNAKNHEREGEIIAQAGRKGNVVIATNMAGRGVDIKLGGNPHTKEEYEEVRNLGGLAVIGTERHEARRIDNQLRGRAGRQGDPGETQFYVSLEDSLMRVFASDMIKNMMGRFGIPEDQPIENKMVSRALEGAQEKIEGFHFDSRKHLLEYDNVMNHQRGVVYERREKMLFGEREYITSLAEEIKLESEEAVKEIEDKRKEMGDDKFYEEFRKLALYTNDMLWLEHLEVMDYLRSSVGLRGYGQRDPLVEYKKEGLKLFKEMEIAFRQNLSATVKLIRVESSLAREAEPIKTVEIHEDASVLGAGRADENPSSSKEVKAPAGRNDPCPCGSGKKYKKCHGA
jgi:preprotein translocase subunit SecA